MEEILEVARASLARTPERWRALAGLPAGLLRRVPEPGEWSALETLGHVIDTEEAVFVPRVHALLAERDFASYDPDVEGSPLPADASPVALAERFASLRVAALGALALVTRADLGKRARHAELGSVSLDEFLHEYAGHDLMHLVQAERAVMQPFIEGCGPWRSSFADHDVAARAAR